MSFVALPELRLHGRSDWQLVSSLIYASERFEVTVLVPSGFVTDLASIPRAFTWLIPVNGLHRAPAIIHDYLYSLQGKLPGGDELSRKDSDVMFKDAMRKAGVGFWKRNTMYAAVRVGGWLPWGRSGE